ncbi:MAG: hypothetical protein K2M43_01535 [Mycoplasmoidaceae bacterium]|nr:hypothetical protein [Mycoplasmoidaceae bacterium]
MAGILPFIFFGIYKSAANVIPKRLLKVTLEWLTLSLLGKTLSHSFVNCNSINLTSFFIINNKKISNIENKKAAKKIAALFYLNGGDDGTRTHAP